MFHHGTRLFSVGTASQSEAFHLSIQPWAVVLENLRGPFNVAAGAFERLRDGFAFDLFHREIRRDNAAEVAAL
jgi:hypothetical protein